MNDGKSHGTEYPRVAFDPNVNFLWPNKIWAKEMLKSRFVFSMFFKLVEIHYNHGVIQRKQKKK